MLVFSFRLLFPEHDLGMRICEMASQDEVESTCACSRTASITSLFCKMILVCAIVPLPIDLNTLKKYRNSYLRI